VARLEAYALQLHAVNGALQREQSGSAAAERCVVARA
jgi:hypothetical protein